MGQGLVLVLVRRLLSRLHAALCAGPDGHDPAHAALRQSGLAPWLIAAAIGAVVILAGIVCQIVQLVVSIRRREQLRDVTGDPWNARTLEWATASPPPAWNFGIQPHVARIDAFWTSKQLAGAKSDKAAQSRKYEPIEMPKNNPTGFVTAFFAVITGFALI